MSIPLEYSRDIHTANVVYVQLGHLAQPATVPRMLHKLDCIYNDQAQFFVSFWFFDFTIIGLRQFTAGLVLLTNDTG